jgi:cytochrome c oxidase assembly protein subunit 15
LDKSRSLSLLALCACIFAFCVIALGAYTRLIDAGLGCPDWPGCYGHFTVPLTDAARDQASTQFNGQQVVAYKAWAEMIHRYAVSGLSLFILAIIGLVLIKREFRTLKNCLASLFLILLLAYQIILGQLTVTLKLLPAIVSQHLLGGFLILSTLWSIYLMNRKKSETYYINSRKLLLFLAVIGFVLLFTQVSLGAWTSTNYASLSCPDFPFCMNQRALSLEHMKAAFSLFSPAGINYEGGVLSESMRQIIQMTHRTGALIITLYLFIFMAIASPKLQDAPGLMKSMYVMIGLLCLQLCLGIMNVIFKLPVASAILHNLTAAMLLLSMITLIFKLAIAKRKVSAS